MPGSKNDNSNSFVYAVFYVVRFNNEQKTEFCSSETLKELIDSNLFIQLHQEKCNVSLDYQKFNSQCHEINMTLAKYGYFLRVFELKSKFRHLALKNPKKQNIVRQLSSCINKRYNGFHVISTEYSKKLRTKFKPINIIYKPIKSLGEEVFSTNDISKSYRNSCGNYIETLVIKYPTGLHLNVIIAESFLQEQINKKDTLKIAPVSLA